MNNRKITVFGGQQRRPNLHIEDVTDLYLETLRWPAATIDGKVYNAGCQNLKLIEIAEIVRKIVGEDVEIVTTSTNDLRSYHISSGKDQTAEVGSKRPVAPVERRGSRSSITSAAFRAGKVPHPMTDMRYSTSRRCRRHGFEHAETMPHKAELAGRLGKSAERRARVKQRDEICLRRRGRGKIRDEGEAAGMRTQAAILVEAGKPLDVDDLEIPLHSYLGQTLVEKSTTARSAIRSCWNAAASGGTIHICRIAWDDEGVAWFATWGRASRKCSLANA